MPDGSAPQRSSAPAKSDRAEASHDKKVIDDEAIAEEVEIADAVMTVVWKGRKAIATTAISLVTSQASVANAPETRFKATTKAEVDLHEKAMLRGGTVAATSAPNPNRVHEKATGLELVRNQDRVVQRSFRHSVHDKGRKHLSPSP